MKHTLELTQGTPLSEMKEVFPSTPIARMAYDEANASIVVWDRQELGDIVALDNGVKYKLKRAGAALKVTFDEAVALFGATFTDKRGVDRLIPPWKGKKSSFMVVPS